MNFSNTMTYTQKKKGQKKHYHIDKFFSLVNVYIKFSKVEVIKLLISFCAKKASNKLVTTLITNTELIQVFSCLYFNLTIKSH
jgi:hypothetical protein